MKKVKSITTLTSLQPEPEKKPSSWFMMNYVLYDIQGKTLVEESFSPEGKLERKVIFQYDQQGFIKSELLYTQGTRLTEILSYRHTEKGHLLEVQHQFEDGSLLTEQYSRTDTEEWVYKINEHEQKEGSIHRVYDGYDRILEETHFDGRDEILSQYVYEYNSHHQLAEHQEFGHNGELLFIYEYTYNHFDQLEKQITYTSEGKVVERHYNYYDNEGRLIKSQINGFITFFSYDAQGRCIKEEVLASNGKPEATSLYTYDEDDLLIRITSYQVGDPYEIEPQVVGRTPATYQTSKLQYEFFEE